MDLVDLRTIEAVARHGSMNRAALELHTVQSNITLRIRRVEHELGVVLFERHARGVVLTDAGKRVLPFTGRIARLVEDARNAARDEGTLCGTLRLGSLESTAALQLSLLLTDFAIKYPRVRLVVNAGSTAGLVRDVIEARLDAAFVAGPVAHTEVWQEPVLQDELVFVTPPAMTTAQQLASLPRLRPVVLHYGCSYRQRLEGHLARLGLAADEPLELGSLDAVLSCVGAGVGVTLLPRTAVVEAAARGRVAVHAVPKDQARVRMLFIGRRDAHVSSALAAFVAMAKAFYAAADPSADRQSSDWDTPKLPPLGRAEGGPAMSRTLLNG